jgi:predicted phage baseplate assembly protein
VRARSESGEFAVPPRLRRLLLNTTWASQATTIFNETLGSSNGNPGQAFQLAQSPVLPGLCLQVREPGMPSPEEEAQIKKLEGPDAITTILDAAGRPEEIWVRWHAVPDFHGSGPRDRHYTVDYLTGTVRFGDGGYGLIPPSGQNNIRATRYRSGGGAGGNRPRETVIQLKASVPYIDRVANFEDASGGANRQSLDRVKRYGTRQLRHRDRAVTVEDFEDLAYAASPDVARAKAIPAFSDDGTQPGVIGLIVLPHSDAPQPIPSLGLLEQVKAYLQARCPATAEAWVAGPVWVKITVSIDVVPVSLAVADQVEIRVEAALERFLHPLSGGPLGKGWPFGRLPHLSDLYALVESVEGVDHVRALDVDPKPDEKGKPDRTGPFLIYSGQHQVTVVTE